VDARTTRCVDFYGHIHLRPPPVRPRMASARAAVGMHKCWGDRRHWFAPSTLAGRVVDARTTRRVDLYGHKPPWPPQYAHEWPVHARRLGRTNVEGTSSTGLQPPRPLVASWTDALPGVWTFMATYFYGHPRSPSNGLCTRRGWDAEVLGGPPTLVCTHHARWSRRGRMHHPACGLLWPHTSVAGPERARRARAHGAVCKAEVLREPPTLDCTHHARWSRRGRMHHPACGLLWPHTSMATPERARMAEARAAACTRKC